MITATPAPIAMAAALAQIAQLRNEAFDLVVPAGSAELARLVRGHEVVIVVVPPTRPGIDAKEP